MKQKKVLFYRVETEDKYGPYRNNLPESLIGYLRNNPDFDKDDYYKKCPTPMCDSDNFSKKVYVILREKSFIFGFNTKAKLKKWFSYANENEYFEKYGFMVSVYETKEIFNSRHQSVAKESDLTLIKRIKFTEL